MKNIKQRNDDLKIKKINIKNPSQEMKELRQINEKDYEKAKKLFIISALLFIVLIVSIFFNVNKKQSKPEENFSYFNIGEEDYFLIYENKLYYKLDYVGIISDVYISEEIGKVDYHLKVQDIDDNRNIKYYNDDKIYCFAKEKDTPIYKYDLRDDVILLKNKDAYKGYDVYILKENFDNNNYSFDYFRKNNEIHSSKIISFHQKELPFDINVSDFKETTNYIKYNYYEKGTMIYLLLIEKDNLCYMYEATGNIFENNIYLNIERTIGESKNIVQFVFEQEGLMEYNLNEYYDYFGFNKEDVDEYLNLYKKINDENYVPSDDELEELIEYIKNNSNNNDSEESTEIIEYDESYIPEKETLKPLLNQED